MGDSFFVQPGARKRARSARAPRAAPAVAAADPGSDIDSDSVASGSDAGAGADDDDEDSSASDAETAADKRRRLAKDYLASLEEELVDGFDAKDLDEDIISRRLRQDAAQSQGHIFRDLSRCTAGPVRTARTSARHLTACCAAGASVYTGAKDGRVDRYRLEPDALGLKCRLQKSRTLRGRVFCVAADSAGRYLAAGLPGRFCVLHAETLESVKEFKVAGDVLALQFRRNSLELYVGGTDLRLRTYDLAQLAFVETLHGHQDSILGISALDQERCVTVGARDRTAIYWKIPEESRLTFRGGDTRAAAQLRANELANARDVVLEGSIDCCAMLDNLYFVTGSDNGNVSLWSTSKKKAVFIEALAHGRDAPLAPARASAERDPGVAEIPPSVPRAITAIAAVPQSNVFVTGSWDGTLRLWALAEDRRSFALVTTAAVGRGYVNGLAAAQAGDAFAVCAALAREPRLGRWRRLPGHDALVAVKIEAAEV